MDASAAHNLGARPWTSRQRAAAELAKCSYWPQECAKRRALTRRREDKTRSMRVLPAEERKCCA